MFQRVLPFLQESDAAAVVRVGEKLIGIDEFDTAELGSRQLRRLLMGHEGKLCALLRIRRKVELFRNYCDINAANRKDDENSAMCPVGSH